MGYVHCNEGCGRLAPEPGSISNLGDSYMWNVKHAGGFLPRRHHILCSTSTNPNLLTLQLSEESHSEYLGSGRTASPRWVAANSYHRTQHRVETRSYERYTRSVFGRSSFVLICAVPSHG